MGQKSEIEWTDATWNPIRGCSRISEGCRNCYAETIAARFSGKGLAFEGLTTGGKWNGKIKVVEEHMLDPLKWKEPKRIFVNSVSDLFHENVPLDVILRILEVMEKAHWHTFQVLTKRADRMVDVLGGSSGAGLSAPALPNVWWGVSVENQKTADERIPYLLQVPAAVRWLSCEPLLGAVNLTELNDYDTLRLDCLGGVYWDKRFDKGNPKASREPDGITNDCIINWVVCGGESGGGARPMNPEWARSLRDQCVAAGVPFFFKQWGNWAPFFYVRDVLKLPFSKRLKGNVGTFMKGPSDLGGGAGWNLNLLSVDGECMHRVDKKDIRVLDGRTWDEYPVAREEVAAS